jgi:hypothetical protein
MTDLERQVIEDRALRDAARAVFDARKAQVESALENKPVGTRLADEALGRAKSAAGDAADVARDNPAVVAGTAVVLLAWLFRRPLTDRVNALLHRDEPGELALRWQRLQDWIKSTASRG